MLTEIVGEYNVTVSKPETPANGLLTRDDVTWTAIRDGDKFPRAVWVSTTGTPRKKVANISKRSNPELWERWQPVLTEWYRRKQTEKRIDHKELTEKLT